MDSKQTHRPKTWEQKESVNKYSTDAPEVYHDEPSLEPVFGDHKASYANNVLEVPQSHPEIGSTKRRTQRRRLWLLVAVTAVLVLLAIGLGVGLHFRSNTVNSTSTNTTSQQSVTTTSSPIPTTSSSSSSSSSSTTTTLPTTSTTAPVTSGTTGIAGNDCKTRGSNEYTTSNNPTNFIFDCEADYPLGEPAYSGDSTVNDLLGMITYTFEECMENCAIYNTQTSITTPCRAITYAANLTASIPNHSNTNCWLKNVRGERYYGNTILLTNSAYADLG